MNEKFYVINWDNKSIVGEFDTLKVAKSACRKLGHTGEINDGLTSIPPIAYVGNAEKDLIYNPRFKKPS